MNSPKRIEPGHYEATVDGEKFEIRQDTKRIETGKTHKGQKVTTWRVFRDGQVQGEHDSYREAKDAVYGAPEKSEETVVVEQPAEPSKPTQVLFPWQW